MGREGPKSKARLHPPALESAGVLVHSGLCLPRVVGEVGHRYGPPDVFMDIAGLGLGSSLLAFMDQSLTPIWSYKQWHLPLKPRTGPYVLLCTHASVCLLVHLLLI